MENPVNRLKSALWSYALDPVIRRVQSRMDHFRSLQSSTHDGDHWRDIASIAENVVFYASASLSSNEKQAISIGAHCFIKGEIVVSQGGCVRIGDHCFVGEHTRIWSAETVNIGSYVLIAHNVDIHDSDSHSKLWSERREEIVRRFEKGVHQFPQEARKAAVVIEDDVWIGLKSTILKGVKIGRGAIVAAGSVVRSDVEPFTLVAGNPATVVSTVPR
jgi:acetyltransferase-like isoleucine patch superfamily enzyme